MKTKVIILMLAVITAAAPLLRAQNNQQDRLGLPGDNLNLYAVMDLFRQSKTLEAFENGMNDPENRINNLDLNGDNYVDYIQVIDYPDGDVHNIVLRDALNTRQSQDVAVFTVQRFSNGQVKIQLTGDEALYGRNYIIEPEAELNAVETPNPGYSGGDIVYVNTWPVVRLIFRPGYMAWHSVWNWGFYPPWWSPWRPVYWSFYFGYHYPMFNNYYSHYYHYSNSHWYRNWDNHYYHGIRVSSRIVESNIHNGHYRYTYDHPEYRDLGEAEYRDNRRYDGRRSAGSTTRTGNEVRRGEVPDNSSRRTASATINYGRYNETSTRNINNAANPVRSEAAGSRRQSDYKTTESKKYDNRSSGRVPERSFTEQGKSRNITSSHPSETKKSISASSSRRSSEGDKRVRSSSAKSNVKAHEGGSSSRRR